MMRPYDPFAFSQPPEDAVLDTDAMLDLAAGPEGYQPQPDNEFLAENPDLPPSDVDPRGMLKGGMEAPGNVLSSYAPEGRQEDAHVAGDGEYIDDEALQQAILDEGMRANELAESYQASGVEQNEEEERRLAKMNNGGV